MPDVKIIRELSILDIVVIRGIHANTIYSFILNFWDVCRSFVVNFKAVVDMASHCLHIVQQLSHSGIRIDNLG